MEEQLIARNCLHCVHVNHANAKGNTGCNAEVWNFTSPRSGSPNSASGGGGGRQAICIVVGGAE